MEGREWQVDLTKTYYIGVWDSQTLKRLSKGKDNRQPEDKVSNIFEILR